MRNCIICGKEITKHLERKPKYCSFKCFGIEKKGVIPWNKGIKTGIIPWNKGTKGVMKAWNKGIFGEKSKCWCGGSRAYYQNIAKKICINAGWNIKGKIIHHINGDYTDNRLDNYKILTRAEHLKLHNPLKNRKNWTAWNKGKKMSEEYFKNWKKARWG